MRMKFKKFVSLFLIVLLLLPSGLVPPATAAAEQTETETVYHENFESGLGKATQSGGASLTHVTDKNFDGNSNGKALYVSNRNNDYDAADFSFTDIGLENGKTYTVTVKGFVDSDVTIPAGAQAVLSTVDSYTWLSNVNYVAGQAFTLTREFTVDTSRNSKLRLQSNGDGKTVPFYIGEIIITAKKETPVEKVVYKETFTDGEGFATRSGSATLTPVTGKVFEGNPDGAALHVTNRNNDYDAVDFSFENIGLKNGKAYTVTVKGFVDNDVTVPSGAQAVLSTVDSYTWLSNVNYVAGQAFTLSKEFTVDTSKDSKLRVQSNGDGKTVPFYIGEIIITEKVTSGGGEQPPAPPREPALEFTTIDFEDGTTGGFVARGGNEILTITNEANHTEGGSKSLKVEGRTQNWNGPSLRVEEYIDLGHEYHVSAMVKLISPSSSQLQLSTQVGSGDTASYNNIQGKTINAADGWVLLEGTFRYNSVGGEFVSIYVESSNNSTASFYIDDVTFKPTGSGTVDIQRDLTPIKDVYKNYFMIGNAVSFSEFEGLRFDLLEMHHNLVSAENAMKPGYAYNNNREFDFTAQNSLVERALEAGFDVHGHVLVWHQQTPEWLFQDATGTALSREVAIENMNRHIEATILNFGDDVISWDVVNEAIVVNGNSNLANWKQHLRQSGWLRAIGDDYVDLAFRKAKEVINANDLDIKLYYNDYNDHFENKSTVMYHMVKELNEAYAKENNGELLIDGIGMQAHYHLHERNTAERVEQSLTRFLSIPGIEVGITELDITAGANGVLTEAEEKAQAYLFAQLFKLYKEHHERISRVTLWGLNDATSWRADRNPLVFDRNLQAKEAYYAIIDPEGYIAKYEAPAEDENTARQGKAVFGTPVIDGTIDDVWKNAPKLPINRYQAAWEGATGVGRVMWDNDNLYVLIEVNDSELDKTAAAAHEQDSIEVFLDQLNTKATSYGVGHGQYRVNFANETSFNPGSISAGFESVTHVHPSGNGYTVELKIPLTEVTPEENAVIGFDLQVNDAKNGARQSVATWNDTSGGGWNDPSVFGNLELVKVLEEQPDPGQPNPGQPSPGQPTPVPPSNEDLGTKLPKNVYEIIVENRNGKNVSVVKIDNGKFTQWANQSEKINKVTIAVESATNVEVRLPAQAVKALSDKNANALVEVVTTGSTYRLPVMEINVDKLAQQLGVTVEDLEVSIVMHETTDTSGAVTKGKLNVVANIVEFKVYVSANDKQVELKQFNSFVEREIIGEKPFNAGKSTAVQLMDDGSFRPVPTLFVGNRAIFKSQSNSKYTIVENTVTFPDITSNYWAKAPIETLASKYIFRGYEDGQFKPRNATTRVQVALLITRSLGLSTDTAYNGQFSDVKGSEWFVKEVMPAIETGIIRGSNGQFRPHDEITREEAAAMFARALRYVQYDQANLDTTKKISIYQDANSISNWAKGDVEFLLQAGIMTGRSNGKFEGKEVNQRAETAALLVRFLKEANFIN
ncbi:endo-1,4-beta-xylanase [Anaerobacillus alkaliphilus]|nr:endo-1,4-beta-xylanase [Anaerobacillus alkaliphilus]